MDRNPRRYEVAEHIATKVEVNPRMLSTLKKEKSILSKNPGRGGGASMVGPLVISVVFFRKKNCRVIPSQGYFLGDPS